MNTIVKYNNNTKLFDISEVGKGVQGGRNVTTIYCLSFLFQGACYELRVARDDVANDNRFGSLLSGPVELFDSFESLAQGDMWEFIKEQIQVFDNMIIV